MCILEHLRKCHSWGMLATVLSLISVHFEGHLETLWKSRFAVSIIMLWLWWQAQPELGGMPHACTHPLPSESSQGQFEGEAGEAQAGLSLENQWGFLSPPLSEVFRAARLWGSQDNMSPQASYLWSTDCSVWRTTSSSCLVNHLDFL